MTTHTTAEGLQAGDTLIVAIAGHHYEWPIAAVRVRSETVEVAYTDSGRDSFRRATALTIKSRSEA